MKTNKKTNQQTKLHTVQECGLMGISLNSVTATGYISKLYCTLQPNLACLQEEGISSLNEHAGFQFVF